MKMPDPMIPPITTIVASKGPRARLKSAFSFGLPVPASGFRLPASGFQLYAKAAPTIIFLMRR